MEENKPEGIAEIPDARLAPENITEEIAAMRDAVLAAELRASACVRAMSGIEDPAAFMEEVRAFVADVLSLVTVEFEDGEDRPCDDLCGARECQEHGCLDAKARAARALLEKMEGK